MSDRYPALAVWVRHHGWIEIGHDGFSGSFIRVLDVGGLMWEGAADYDSVDDALWAAEEAVDAWMSRHLGGPRITSRSGGDAK